LKIKFCRIVQTDVVGDVVGVDKLYRSVYPEDRTTDRESDDATWLVVAASAR
jgi:hypothetical protein